PAGAADRELADRRELGFPPVTALAELTGSAAGVEDLLQAADLPADAILLGPQPAPPRRAAPGAGRSPDEAPVRALIRVPREGSDALARALAAAQATRSARKAADVVRLRIDPADLG
ncbi:MAG TPA: hypothetical protein VEV13_01140, partial [Candidatus Limnocylindria bacterium]|nr:hypothetical protein [Candidatus Limnocylindria bacterium]